MAEKKHGGQFRDALRGYNKEDVNAYIQSMFRQFEEREKQLQARIKDLQAKTQEIPAPILESQAVAERDLKIARLENTVREMKEQNARYEKMSAQVGDLMLKAQSDAEVYAKTLRDEAMKQADTIISYACDRMKHLYNEETKGYEATLESLRHQTEHFAEKLDAYRASFPEEMKDAHGIAFEALDKIPFKSTLA